jgi:hypothetical protein
MILVYSWSMRSNWQGSSSWSYVSNGGILLAYDALPFSVASIGVNQIAKSLTIVCL